MAKRSKREPVTVDELSKVILRAILQGFEDRTLDI
jgi:hypothetical protein